MITSTPNEHQPIGRRRSVSSFAYIYRCNHHASGFVCNCWSDCEDTTPQSNETHSLSQKLKNNFLKSLQQPSSNTCICKESVSRQSSLGLCNIKEVQESTENLLGNNNSTVQTLTIVSTSSRDDKNTDSGLSGCDKCDKSSRKSRTMIRKHRGVHRTCSCQYLSAGDIQCGLCGVAGSSTTTSNSGSNGDHTERVLDADTVSNGSAVKRFVCRSTKYQPSKIFSERL